MIHTIVSVVGAWWHDPMTAKILPVVVDWAHGIASTLGVDRHRDRRRKQRILAGLRIEFGRVEAGMAMLFWTSRKGGTDTIDNFAVACVQCNLGKGAKFL